MNLILSYSQKNYQQQELIKTLTKLRGVEFITLQEIVNAKGLEVRWAKASLEFIFIVLGMTGGRAEAADVDIAILGSNVASSFSLFELLLT